MSGHTGLVAVFKLISRVLSVTPRASHGRELRAHHDTAAGPSLAREPPEGVLRVRVTELSRATPTSHHDNITS